MGPGHGPYDGLAGHGHSICQCRHEGGLLGGAVSAGAPVGRPPLTPLFIVWMDAEYKPVKPQQERTRRPISRFLTELLAGTLLQPPPMPPYTTHSWMCFERTATSRALRRSPRSIWPCPCGRQLRGSRHTTNITRQRLKLLLQIPTARTGFCLKGSNTARRRWT